MHNLIKEGRRGGGNESWGCCHFDPNLVGSRTPDRRMCELIVHQQRSHYCGHNHFALRISKCLWQLLLSSAALLYPRRSSFHHLALVLHHIVNKTCNDLPIFRCFIKLLQLTYYQYILLKKYNESIWKSKALNVFSLYRRRMILENSNFYWAF
jgi:hypothetical protein